MKITLLFTSSHHPTPNQGKERGIWGVFVLERQKEHMQNFANVYQRRKVNSGPCNENEFPTKIKKRVWSQSGFIKMQIF